MVYNPCLTPSTIPLVIPKWLIQGHWSKPEYIYWDIYLLEYNSSHDVSSLSDPLNYTARDPKMACAYSRSVELRKRCISWHNSWPPSGLLNWDNSAWGMPQLWWSNNVPVHHIYLFVRLQLNHVFWFPITSMPIGAAFKTSQVIHKVNRCGYHW